VETKINDLNFNYMMEKTESYPAIIASSKEESDAYKTAVSRMRQEVIKGNLLQGVPSRRLEIATEMPALEAYRTLRSSNPSPYQFYLDFGAWQLFGASPEVQVKVQNGRVTLRPIAGTRRRGRNESEDRELAAELLSDEKERAEHLMLVDLGRNDLGRVCDVGTVEVTEMMGIEKYSKVMHIVSQVEGKLSSGKSSADVIRATFPAGTVSGAPKIQAVKTIAALEAMPRSFYAGLVGYLEPNGCLDSCITIRSALKKENRLFLQAGGGVVYDSNPERELEETNEKLRALALAAGVEI
jgi:anthranilate synthase component 1